MSTIVSEEGCPLEKPHNRGAICPIETLVEQGFAHLEKRLDDKDEALNVRLDGYDSRIGRLEIFITNHLLHKLQWIRLLAIPTVAAVISGLVVYLVTHI